MGTARSGRWYDWMFILSEIIVIIIFATYTEFETGAFTHPGSKSIKQRAATTKSGIQNLQEADKVQRYYPLLQDMTAMVFIGFGCLRAFLKQYAWTAVAYNFLIGVWALQITILMVGFWRQAIVEESLSYISLDMHALVIGEFGAATVMISMGALLGKCTLPQLWMLTIIEVFFYALNESICLGLLEAVDVGGCITVHTFGAYFGIAASFFFETRAAKREMQNKEQGLATPGYNAQTVGLLGTIFLFTYFPSFNCIMAVQYQQHRIILNTVLSLTASVVSACAVSRMYTNRLNIEVVMNATFAGGVAIGSVTSLIVPPYVAMCIGGFAGIVSAYGYLRLVTWWQESGGLYDTCGVQFSHGVPGIIGAICSAIAAAFCDYSLSDRNNVTEQALIDNIFFSETPGLKRSRAEQGWLQISALGVTIALAVLSGSLSGFLCGKAGEVVTIFDDEEHWDEVADYDMKGAVETERQESEANAVPVDFEFDIKRFNYEDQSPEARGDEDRDSDPRKNNFAMQSNVPVYATETNLV